MIIMQIAERAQKESLMRKRINSVVRFSMKLESILRLTIVKKMAVCRIAVENPPVGSII